MKYQPLIYLTSKKH